MTPQSPVAYLEGRWELVKVSFNTIFDWNLSCVYNLNPTVTLGRIRLHVRATELPKRKHDAPTSL